jgi:hypothetical protein
MFDYTKEALSLTVSDLKRFLKVFTVASNVLYISYLIYALCVGAGQTFANIILLSVVSSYFVFYLCTLSLEGDKMKKLRTRIRRITVWFKIGIKALTLSIAIYGFYAASTHFTPVSVMLTSLVAIIWIGQIFIEIVCYYIENRINLFKTALDADFEGINEAKRRVGNVVKILRGEETVKKDSTLSSSKTRRKLDSLVKETRDSEKEKKKEQRRTNRLYRKQQLLKLTSNVKDGIKSIKPKRKIRDVEMDNYIELTEENEIPKLNESQEPSKTVALIGSGNENE